MSHRLTSDIIARTNAQRKRLGKPLLSREGLERACKYIPQDHSADVLIIALVNWVIPNENMHSDSAAYEIPAASQTAAPLADVAPPDAGGHDAGFSVDPS